MAHTFHCKHCNCVTAWTHSYIRVCGNDECEQYLIQQPEPEPLHEVKDQVAETSSPPQSEPKQLPDPLESQCDWSFVRKLCGIETATLNEPYVDSQKPTTAGVSPPIPPMPPGYGKPYERYLTKDGRFARTSTPTTMEREAFEAWYNDRPEGWWIRQIPTTYPGLDWFCSYVAPATGTFESERTRLETAGVRKQVNPLATIKRLVAKREQQSNKPPFERVHKHSEFTLVAVFNRPVTHDDIAYLNRCLDRAYND